MYAHSVKNPHIIHMVKDGRYLCVGAFGTTLVKSTTDIEEVTCLNCLRKIMKTPAEIREEIDLYQRTARGVREEAKEKREDGNVINARIKEDQASRYDQIANALEWVMGVRVVP